jgi:hypothetical protein
MKNYIFKLAKVFGLWLLTFLYDFLQLFTRESKRAQKHKTNGVFYNWIIHFLHHFIALGSPFQGLGPKCSPRNGKNHVYGTVCFAHKTDDNRSVLREAFCLRYGNLPNGCSSPPPPPSPPPIPKSRRRIEKRPGLTCRIPSDEPVCDMVVHIPYAVSLWLQ